MTDKYSLEFPKTNRVAINGSTIRTFNSDLIKTDRDDNFTTDIDDSLWTESITGDVTKVTGEPLRLDLSATDTTSAEYKLTSSWSKSSYPFTFEFGFNLNTSGTSDPLEGNCKIVSIRSDDSGTSKFFEIFVADGDNGRSLEVDAERDGSAVLDKSYTFTEDQGQFRIVFNESSNSQRSEYCAIYKKTSSGYTLLDSFLFQMDWTDPWVLSSFLDVTSSGTQDLSLWYRDFLHFPYLKGISCDNATRRPFCINYNQGEATWDIDPLFPHKRDLTLYGNGSQDGNTENLGELRAEPVRVGEDEVKFLISPVETLYDDSSFNLACRNKAVPDVSNHGDMEVLMKCICDGTAEDENKATVKTEITAFFDDYNNRKQGPKFTVKDETDGAVYGENFNFDRIYQNEDDTLTVNNETDIKSLRMLELSNNDRVYYGAQYSPVSSKSIVIDWASTSDVTYNIVEIDTDGVESEVVSAATATDGNPVAHTLNNGNYYLELDSAGAKFNADIYYGSDTADLSNNELIESYKSDSVAYSKVYFDVKELKGEPIIYYHDICNNTITLNEPFSAISGKIDIKTDSYALVERDDGKLVFIHQFIDDTNDYWDIVEDSILDYIVIDPSDFTNNGINSLTDGDFKDFYAFDVFKTINNQYNLIFSSRNNHTKYRFKTNDNDEVVEENINYRPFLNDGLDTVTFHSSKFDWHDTDDFLIQPLGGDNQSAVEVGSIGFKSFKRFFKFRSPDVVRPETGSDGNKKANITRAGIESVKAEYDSDRRQAVLSTYDWRHKCPFIHQGSSLNWKEVTIPFHFNIAEYAYTPEEHLRNSASNVDEYFGLTSFHASYGYDGMIYSIATKDDPDYNCEIGVVDPDILSNSTRNEVVKYNENSPAGNTTEESNTDNYLGLTHELDFYQPEFQFEAIPFACSYGGDNGVGSASISRDEQHNIICFGKNRYLHGDIDKPVVYQNNEYSDMPFETFSESLWIPEFGESTDWNVNADVDAFTFNENNLLLKDDDPFLGEVEFEYLSTPPDNGHSLPNLGYKYHMRANVTNGAETGAPNDDVTIEATIKNDTLSTRAEAQFLIDGTGDLKCQILSNDGTSTVHTFSNYRDGTPKIIDYYIIVQNHFDDKFRVIFAYKDRDSNIIEGSNYKSVYLNKNSQFISKNTQMDDASDTWDFRIFFQSDDDNDTKAYIYEAGWNVLKARTGVKYTYDPKSNDFGSTKKDGHWGEGRWRGFDDSKLFAYLDNTPQYYFKPGEVVNKSRSNYFHWPNGFEYALSEGSAFIGDKWELSRERLTDTATLASSKLHGLWFTSGTSDVKIWADAHDADLDKFDFNTVVLAGNNFRKINIIGRDSDIDSWTQIDSFDTTKYKFDSEELNDVTDIVSSKDNKFNNLLFSNEDFQSLFNKGEFEEFQHYYVQKDSFDFGKIFKNSQKNLYIEDDTPSGSGLVYSNDSEIFVDRYCHVLDSMQRYRYVGIEIAGQSAYNNRFELTHFDFGFNRNIPLEYNHDIDSGKSYKLESNSYYVYDEQGFTSNRKKIKVFDINYTFTDASTFIKFKSMMENISYNRRPIWIIENQSIEPWNCYLCLLDDDISQRIITDFNGDKFYELGFTLRSVE